MATQTTGEGSTEITIEDLLYKVMNDIDKQIDKLNIDTKSLINASKKIKRMIYAPLKPGEIPPELKQSDVFRNAIDVCHHSVGKIVDYVIRVERTRKYLRETRISELRDLLEESEEDEGKKREGQPINVSVSQPQAPSVERPGFFWAHAEIKKAEIAAKLERERMAQQQLPVVTTQQVEDIMNFGRQMPSAFNQVKQWLPSALALVRVFKNDDHLFFLLHEEVATYLSQTLGTLVAFAEAAVEYRKTLLEGRKLGMARAIAKIAEAQSYAPQITSGGKFSETGFKAGKEGFEAKR